jgi:hypothetical protein
MSQRKKPRTYLGYVGTGNRIGSSAGYKSSSQSRMTKAQNEAAWKAEAKERGITVAQLLVENME